MSVTAVWRYQTVNCVRVWRKYILPAWTAPEKAPLRAAIGCVRGAATAGLSGLGASVAVTPQSPADWTSAAPATAPAAAPLTTPSETPEMALTGPLPYSPDLGPGPGGSYLYRFEDDGTFAVAAPSSGSYVPCKGHFAYVCVPPPPLSALDATALAAPVPEPATSLAAFLAFLAGFACLRLWGPK